MGSLIPRVIGSGWKVPDKIRYNNDPIFDWIKEHLPNANKMFDGYDERHVLSDGEYLIDIMIPASQYALDNAGVKPEDIDILIGWGSISEFIQPNTLIDLHKRLGLRKDVWCLPVCDDYSNFNSSVMLADGLLRAGRAKNILICCGGNWTRNVSYHTPQAISAADGAGAAVMAMSDDNNKWAFYDQCTYTVSENYGTMYTDGIKLQADPPIQDYKTVYSPHFFQITKEGLKGFKDFGEVESLKAITGLVKKTGISLDEISFLPHQTSQVLIDYWVAHLNPRPAQVLSTLQLFANTTVAIHAINFAWFEEHGDFAKDAAVFFALGPGMHANAMMMRRKI